ncbi:MAG: enoyl-CoA hydratase/isomerase family protein [Candidatus Tectomicrobia bacterium]|uniref:Enoyl-CoA hydratase/isomerase family protein n=1 Tax=Tectimicrobiota bacterium TaxID=2528274 RepID=A0A933GKV9_UNCTE|nr:enoyl-CoA hydratase/isomerase family protein [Candidatus Tectomicrobia bacterium]
MAFQHIIYEPGKVARVILNRPRYLNAQSYLMREEMDEAFNQAVTDDQVGVIVLSGLGDHFSAGHDLGTKEDVEYRLAHGHYTLQAKSDRDRFETFTSMRAICLENTLRWRNLPKPTIAMVNGYCIFAGCMFASAMDVIFATEDALFLPGPVQYFHAPWDLGPRKSKEVLFEHRFMTASEACKHGFVNRVFPKESLERETLSYAERVADNYLHDPFWVRMTKFSINHMQDSMGFTEAIEAAYSSYCTMIGLTKREIPATNEGGFARTHVARKNFEASKAWIESES